MSKKDERQDEQGVCPTCGHCPHCHQRHQPERIVYVPMPYPVPAAPQPQPSSTPYNPYNPNPWLWPQVICGSGSISMSELPGYKDVTTWNTTVEVQ